jgi:hypothetical protein
MPDANQIEGYGGDKNLAFGSSALPAASNDAIVDSSPAIKYWAQYAQNKLGVAKDALDELRKKQLLAQAAAQKKLDIGQYKIIPEDYGQFNKLWEKLRSDLKEPGVAAAFYSGDASDPNFQKIQKQIDYLTQFSSFSTQQGAHADVTYNDASGNPDKYVDAFNDIKNYRNIGDPFKRAQVNLEPQPNISLDFPAYVAKLKSSITPTQEVTTQMVGGRYEDTTETLYSADKIDAATKVDYQTNKKFKAEADEAFGELIKTDPQAAQTFGTPQRYASATAWDMLNGGNKVTRKNPFFYPGAADAQKKPEFDYQPNIPINVASSKGTVFKITNDGVTRYKVKDANGNTLKDANGKDLSYSSEKQADEAQAKAGGTRTWNTLGGWYLSGIAEFPSNVNITAPQKLWDIGGNLMKTGKSVDVGTAKIDGVTVVDTYQNDKGQLVSTDQVTDQDKNNYDKIRVAQIHFDNGISYVIPYDKNISIPFENALKGKGIPEEKLPSNVPIGGQRDQSTQQKNQQPKVLTGKVDPASLVKGEQYSVNGKVYIWDGQKLKPQ